MKVLFLDFDGVLNYERYVNASSEYGLIIDPERMFLLKRIIRSTHAKIVLTTSWREHWTPSINDCDETGKKMNAIFAEHGLEIYDKTPQISRQRETEIEAWLSEHPETENFVVVDDRYLDSKVIRGRFVKTKNYSDGLDESDANEIIKILE